MDYLVSVIIPVYNVEHYLKECVDSIINQTYKNLQIILVDDESPDNCGEICDQYAKLDSRVRVIHQKNTGLSGARNSGLEIANGDYVSFIDSDDWVDLDMFETLLNIAYKHSLDIVECGITESFAKEEKTLKKEKLAVTKENSLESLKRTIKKGEFSAVKRLYKNNVIKQLRFKLNKTSEDNYFSVDVLRKARKIGYIEFPFYNYRANPSSITKSSYSLKRLYDSTEAGLYVLNTIENDSNSDKELKNITKRHLLNKLLMHYKFINYNSKLDPNFEHRKFLKDLISKNYFKSQHHNFYLKLAQSLSVNCFSYLIKINHLKHKIFSTKSFINS